jgi:hypothetical protein
VQGLGFRVEFEFTNDGVSIWYLGFSSVFAFSLVSFESGFVSRWPTNASKLPPLGFRGQGLGFR